MPGSYDPLLVIITRCSSMTWNTAPESTFLDLHDIAWSSRFLQPEQNFFSPLVTLCYQLRFQVSRSKCFWLLRRRYGPVQTLKKKVPELVKVACSSVGLSTYTQCEALPQWNCFGHMIYTPQLLRSHDIYTASWLVRNYCKSLDTPVYFDMWLTYRTSTRTFLQLHSRGVRLRTTKEGCCYDTTIW